MPATRLNKLAAIAGVPILALLLGGCAPETMPIVFPDGPVALAERDILFRAFWIMMLVLVPVFIMAAWFTWRYRATNTKARYEPNWISDKLDALIWVVPTLIVLSLGIHVWIYTHALDPYKPLDPSVKALEIEVVAQDWKWLFIYPEEGIASVNELAIPVDVPLRLKITSDTVMNSFFLPALGGQIYAMAGMQTQLNLIAGAPGRFVGRNTQYSGDGFADQHFAAIAMDQHDFDAWVEKVRQDGTALDAATYAELAKPTIAQPVTYFSTVAPHLFATIIGKYDSGMTSRAMPADHGPMGGQ